MSEKTPQTPGASTKQGDQNLIAVLSYLGILFLIPLLVVKDNRFVQFHAKQGLVLFIAEIATVVIAWIPILGWIAGFILWIVWFVFSIMGIVNVLGGKKTPLPMIGKFAGKFKI
ncbi:DUF4870 domain-containing protein [Patescibacteria group bacterium]|nr:DUF4870 domain-containing protein [Patescibacteria group bacterium]